MDAQEPHAYMRARMCACVCVSACVIFSYASAGQNRSCWYPEDRQFMAPTPRGAWWKHKCSLRREESVAGAQELASGERRGTHIIDERILVQAQ